MPKVRQQGRKYIRRYLLLKFRTGSFIELFIAYLSEHFSKDLTCVFPFKFRIILWLGLASFCLRTIRKNTRCWIPLDKGLVGFHQAGSWYISPVNISARLYLSILTERLVPSSLRRVIVEPLGRNSRGKVEISWAK